MINPTSCEVILSVALSDSGDIEVCHFDENNLQRRANYDLWLRGLKSSGKLWSVKTVKTTVSDPVQYEEIL